MRTGAAVARFQLGVLTIADVLGSLDEDSAVPQTVEALVVPQSGMPFVGVVVLTKKPSGPGEHHALQCPTCTQPSLRLYVYGNGRLGCASCARRHPRRNAESNCTSWSLGGREEDRLLRLIAGRSRPTNAAIEDGLRLLHELSLGDQDRAAAAIQLGTAAISATEETP